MKILWAVCSLFLCLFCGCGYTTRSQIGEVYRTIYVAPFENRVNFTKETYTHDKHRIYRPGLETDITSAVVNKFLFDGNLRPVAEEKARLLLKGALVEFRKDPIRRTDNDDVSEFRVNIVVDLTLSEAGADSELWREGRFTGDTTYFTTGAQAVPESTAISAAIDDLARRIVERCVEDW